MGNRSQLGQVLIETLFVVVFFSAIFIFIQGIMDHQKKITKQSHISHEVQYDMD